MKPDLTNLRTLWDIAQNWNKHNTCNVDLPEDVIEAYAKFDRQYDNIEITDTERSNMRYALLENLYVRSNIKFELVTIEKEHFFDKDHILRQKCEPIEVFDTMFLIWCEEFIKFFKSIENGVGIAAPQVGHLQQVFIMNPNRKDGQEPFIVVNPEIINSSIEKIEKSENCLSIPGLKGNVPRFTKIEVKYQDLYGVQVKKELVDFEARVFQHELDHLNGILYLDRMNKNDELAQL